MTENRVYLVGYANRKPSELLAACERLAARLVDIRFSPSSRRPEWSGKRLREVFGERYAHVRAFGNADYQHNRIRLADAEAGLLAVSAMLAESSVVLMCQCAKTQGCHREVVADLLRDQLGVEVIELDAALAEGEPHQLGLFGGAL